jgi:hypothetical protein
MAERTFEKVIGSYAPDVQLLALSAREFVMEMLPGAEESVDSKGPYITYGYAPGYQGIVCGLTVSKQGVKLGFPGGSELPDPKGLLEGDGKSIRHIPLTSMADLRKPGVKPLMRSALSAWKKRQPRAKKKPAARAS